MYLTKKQNLLSQTNLFKKRGNLERGSSFSLTDIGKADIFFINVCMWQIDRVNTETRGVGDGVKSDNSETDQRTDCICGTGRGGFMEI